MTSFSNPRTLLLDLDNTVYPYAPCHRSGLAVAQQAAAEMASIWRDESRFDADYRAARAAVKERVGRQAAAHCRLLYFKTLLEDLRNRSSLRETRRLHAAYWEGYFAAMHLDDGCAETLDALRRRGTRIVWVTSFTTERQMLKLEHLGLSEAADYLLTSEEAGVEKPSGRLVDLALERLGAPSDEGAPHGGAWGAPHGGAWGAPEAGAWVVGDNPREDGGMAEARQLPFVWLRRPDAEADGAARATHTVTDWRELRRVLHDAARA